MTKAQIRAELRRSATEDEFPMREIEYLVFLWVDVQSPPGSHFDDLSANDQRTYFLLLSESL